MTFRVWRPIDDQFNSLINFLLAEDVPESSPFSLAATGMNVHRHDPWDAMGYYNIFRDPWERAIPEARPQSRDVYSTGDYPGSNIIPPRPKRAPQVFGWGWSAQGDPAAPGEDFSPEG